MLSDGRAEEIEAKREFYTIDQVVAYFNEIGIEEVIFEDVEMPYDVYWGGRIFNEATLLDKATRMAREFYRLKSMYPEMDTDVLSRVYITSIGKGMATVPEKGATRIMLTVMDELTDSQRELQKYYRIIMGYNWGVFSHGNTVETVLRHEIAHTLTTKNR
jgi:hypothetical protein